MPFWTYDNLARVTGGVWRVAPENGQAQLPAAQQDAGPILCHDTRALGPGQCYLAIKGENFDGHGFVAAAFDAGAALAIVDNQSSVLDHAAPVLAVPDAIKALQDLAHAYRDELKHGGCQVIGVAGSNGKTTTRHLIHHVLTHAGRRGTQSPKSFNNHLGVPLTLLAARPHDHFVACEIGTNHPGEIGPLSAIARPDAAVITSIGEEHLEFFKTIENVAREEAAILDHVAVGGWVVAPETDWNRHLSQHNTRPDLQITHGLPVPLTGETSGGGGASRGWPTSHPHMHSNARLAATVATHMGLGDDAIGRALACATLPPGRCEVRQIGGLTVIHDAYNANPSSSRAAIDALGSVAAGRKVMVFGDMLELGEQSADAHRGIGARAEAAGIDQLITIGAQAGLAAQAVEHTPAHAFGAWSDDLPDRVVAFLRPGDTVLLKASRGMRLERLIPAIEKQFGEAQAPTAVP